MKRILLLSLLLSLLLPLSACSVLYPGFTAKEPSLAGMEIGKTTYRQALGKQGTPAMSVMEYPQGMRTTYLFKTPEAIIDRGEIMRGSYRDGCRKCGQLTLAFERTDRSVDNMVLVGIARSTPDLQKQHESGLGHINRGEFQLALPLIEAAAQGRYNEAEWTLGLMHLRGDGVARDFSQAHFWLRRAAATGHIQARYDLGAMYRNGEGVAVNREAAKALYLMSAQAGYALAAQELAKLYQEEGDQANAAKWQEFARKEAARPAR
ncbi:MAG: tetratricopeptide repeat protein [Pseudomonadota bacterium]